jgi:hypothetical protein
MTTVSAVEMAQLVREKRVSPVELLSAHLEKIELLQPRLNAFVHLDGERAIEQARQAEAAWQQNMERAPLFGVPISIKSSIDVAGLRCEAGTRLRAGYVASSDAPLVERLKRAGAIVVGNTNTERAHVEPLGPGSDRGRIQRRRISSHCGRMRSGRSRQRRRRIYSRARALHRHLRTQTNAGANSGDATFSRLRRTLRLHGSGGADGADDCGPKDSVARHVGLRSR